VSEAPGLIRFWARGFSLFALVGLGAVATAAMGRGRYTVEGVPVTAEVFLRHSGLMLGGLGLYSAALGYGFWRGRTWARPLLLLLAIGFAGYGVQDVLRTRGWDRALILALADLLFVSALYWYLYRKQNVAAYYTRLNKQ
jgi:Predicted membrane protein (DUF2127)